MPQQDPYKRMKITLGIITAVVCLMAVLAIVDITFFAMGKSNLVFFIISLIVLIALMVIGSLYVWQTRRIYRIHKAIMTMARKFTRIKMKTLSTTLSRSGGKISEDTCLSSVKVMMDKGMLPYMSLKGSTLVITPPVMVQRQRRR